LALESLAIRDSNSGSAQGKIESPEYVRTSCAAAMALNLMSGLFYRDAKPRCINLLEVYEDGCKASCAYCGLSRVRPGKFGEKSFIRVEWPTYKLDLMLKRLAIFERKLGRICISMITHPRASKDVIEIARCVRSATSLPMSALVTPTIVGRENIVALRSVGVDMIGVAIDAATEELFDRFRGKSILGPHRWNIYWKVLREAVQVMGRGKVGCHLIVGLGETDKEIIAAMQRVRDLGAKTHLFSFYPEEGSMLQLHPRPFIGRYRAIQVARYLIDNGLSDSKLMGFDESRRVKDFGISMQELDEIIDRGEAFMTSGCPDKDGLLACNRPFANERPSEPLRNFPFKPEKQDIEQTRRQISSYYKRC